MAQGGIGIPRARMRRSTAFRTRAPADTGTTGLSAAASTFRSIADSCSLSKHLLRCSKQVGFRIRHSVVQHNRVASLGAHAHAYTASHEVARL